MGGPNAPPLTVMFQSQGRFFGGCCADVAGVVVGAGEFQSQGRFFGGCCFTAARITSDQHMFQSQGRFFGGCCSN